MFTQTSTSIFNSFPKTFTGWPWYGFNGKENDNEVYGSTGTFQDYGMRMYDTRLGRFISVDPLFRDYPELSTYQFASNSPIWAIDLDGLEAKIAISGKGQADLTDYKKSDVNAFDARAKNLKKYGYKAYQVETGTQLVQVLVNATKTEGSIQSVVIFAHGGSNAIYLNSNEGLYNKPSDDKNYGESMALYQAALYGDIKFEKNATIIFGSCHAGTAGGIAESITLGTGVTTYAASGTVIPEIINNKETGRLKTVKGEGDTEAQFYKIERVTIENSINILGIEIKYDTYEIKRTNLGDTIDPKDYQTSD